MKTVEKLVLAGLSAGLVLAVPAYAAEKEKPKLQVRTDIKLQAIGEDNTDLGTVNGDFVDSRSAEAKMRVTYDPLKTVRFLWEGRAVKNHGETGSEDPNTGANAGREDFLEWRQSWVEFKSLGGREPASLKVGRQRFSEPYSLWWSRDFDALRLGYESTLSSGFLAVGENLVSYRTSHDDFMAEDEGLLRVLAEESWQWRPEQFIDFRFMWQDDHSGMEYPGSLVPTDNRDSSDANLFWGGLRASGKTMNPVGGENVGYRLDLMGLTGTDEVQTTGAGPGGFRTVTATRENDVTGWALDAGLTVPLPVRAEKNPVAIIGYAFATGDDNAADSDDESFRQTGLDGNYSRPGIASESLHNYGSILRPDLANIHVATLGVGVPVFKTSDVSMLYHHYRLDEPATALETSGIDAPLNGNDHDLGQGVDVMLNVDIASEFSLTNTPFDSIDLKTTLGVFRSGDAYGPDGDGETAARGLTELRFRF